MVNELLRRRYSQRQIGFQQKFNNEIQIFFLNIFDLCRNEEIVLKDVIHYRVHILLDSAKIQVRMKEGL